MEKVLKVSKMPSGKKYVPAVRIAGDYLAKFNFNLNDNVIVRFKKDKIIIEKAENNDLLALLCRKNNTLNAFVDTLGLELI